MKMGKRAVSLCALVVGATLLATSALADVMIGSGYNNFKDAVKTTAAALTGEADSFTLEMTSDVKFDGESLNYQSNVLKADVKGNKAESTSRYTDQKRGTSDRYFYTDSTMSVSKLSQEDIYHVIQREDNDVMSSRISNPFEDEMADDAEKIVDAMVGSLKDVIQIEENDGKKMFTGNITEAQVPALINAVLSFGVKYSIADSNIAKEYGIPALTSDIYVRDASGKAIANADGILESIVGKGSIIGKDKNGGDHVLTVELAVNVAGVNSTSVETPNLEGKNVEYHQETRSSGFSKKYIGTYKDDIVDENGEGLEKIGERVLEITSIEGDTVTGKYYETYRDGVVPQESPLSFEFTGNSHKYGYSFAADYTDLDGETKTLSVHSDGGVEGQSITLELDRVQTSSDGYSIRGGSYSLKRVFE